MPLEAIVSRRRSLVAAPEAGEAARRELGDLAAGVERDVVDRGRLVVTELVANSVRHAGLRAGQRITIGLSLRPERLRIDVADKGRGFDAIAVSPDAHREGGWGLRLVDRLTDRWGVAPGPGAHVWCELDRSDMERPRSAAPSGVRPREGPLLQAVGAFLAEEAGAASYRCAQREALRGTVEGAGPHPVEFDESGFPIRQTTPRFLQRVARLLKP